MQPPIPQNPPSPQAPAPFPWRKVLLGLGAIGAACWAIDYLTSDPEPRRIKELAKEREDEGALVFADVKGYPQPPTVNGCRPDVLAYHLDGTEEMIEVENEKSILGHHAAKQERAFEKWANRSGRRSFQFEVVTGGRGGRS